MDGLAATEPVDGIVKVFGAQNFLGTNESFGPLTEQLARRRWARRALNV